VAETVTEVAGSTQGCRRRGGVHNPSFPASYGCRQGLSPLRHTPFTACAPWRRRGDWTLEMMMNVTEPSRSETPLRAIAGIAAPPPAPVRRETVFDIDGLSVAYGNAPAIRDASLEI